MVIYVDVLVLLNAIITYFLLRATQLFLKIPVSSFRLIVGAICGAAFSLLIFVRFPYSCCEYICNLLFSLFLSWFVFRCKSIRRLGKVTLIFWGVNFAFAGGMAALWMVFSPKGMALNNGIVYFHISPILLVVMTVGLYGILYAYERWSLRLLKQNESYEVCICYEGKKTTLRGFLDTGNQLTDPFGSVPVILCGLESIQNILSQEIYFCVQHTYDANTLPPIPKMRFLPYNSVGHSGILCCFSPDWVRLRQKNGWYQVDQVLIGVVPQKTFEAGEILLNPKLHFHKVEEGFVYVDKKTV